MATTGNKMSAFRKHPDGYESADYKLGYILRSKGKNGAYKYDVSIYPHSYSAKSLANAKQIIDKHTNKMAKKKATPKQLAAQKKFAANTKKVTALLKSGKAKTRKAAWKQIK